MRSLLPLLLSACLTGCLPLAAGYVGGQVAQKSQEDVQVYLASHDVDSTMARAMLNGRLVEGMSPPEARLVMDGNRYDKRTVTKGDSLRWSYTSSDPKYIGQYELVFADSALVRWVKP